ncbi:MAG: cytochrome b5 [Deltaproteobacteria bacterium]|nr:cytochrome b5 [Deltaproteobacteria bacterium]
MKKITRAELATSNGKEGKPTYIAYEGKVYDLGDSKLWIKGGHMKRHNAGALIVDEIKDAPHGPEVLERFSVAGELLEEAPAEIPASAEGEPTFRDRMKPFEWHIKHGHPMTVHYPIAFMTAVSFFVLLYLLTGHRAFETTSFYLMALGLIAAPVAIITGLITWWYNYNAAVFYIIRRKMQLSAVLCVVGLVMVIWRASVPEVLTGDLKLAWLYVIAAFIFTPLVALLGYYGGKLTFGS